ncbi:MAG: ABC transporter ATP-binding protein [Clostridia bacterium]|nr:ABC transporter ATP-binding protein [Clostridia bacterium]MBQ7911996.1 ABC transporter ATP-binding protein [Clostridia bacterium]
MKVLECEAIIKQYRLYDHVVTAVNRASLTVEEGEFIAITGESGSGKSTFLHIAAGLDVPDSGSVRLLGKDIVNMKADELCRFRGKHTGFVFQSHRLVPYLTALENILLPISASGGDQGRVEHRLELLIDRLSLGDRLNHLPRELSGGQQQRVAIARALIHYPMVLFADEPTGNLDRKNAEDVTSLLVSLRDELKQTLVIVTHDETLADRADRAYRMVDGEMYVRR